MPDPRTAGLSTELAAAKGRGRLVEQLMQKQLDDQLLAHERHVDAILDRLVSTSQDAADKIADNVINARVEAALTERELQAERNRHIGTAENLTAITRQLHVIANLIDGQGTDGRPQPVALAADLADRVDDLIDAGKIARESRDETLAAHEVALEYVGLLEDAIRSIAAAARVDVEGVDLDQRAEQIRSTVAADGVAAHVGRRLAAILSEPAIRADGSHPISEDTLADYAREAVNAIGQVEKLTERAELSQRNYEQLAGARQQELQTIAQALGLTDKGHTAAHLARRAGLQRETIDNYAAEQGRLHSALGSVSQEVDTLKASIAETEDYLGELAIALGIDDAQDPADGIELLDRARTLLADRDAIEAKFEHELAENRALQRRVEQLTAANVALRGPIEGPLDVDDDVVDSEVIDYDDPRHPDYVAPTGPTHTRGFVAENPVTGALIFAEPTDPAEHTATAVQSTYAAE